MNCCLWLVGMGCMRYQTYLALYFDGGRGVWRFDLMAGWMEIKMQMQST